MSIGIELPTADRMTCQQALDYPLLTEWPVNKY